MPAHATLVIGAQWGDEGKGKMIDILAAEAKICLRAQGGSNAGHSLVHDGQSFAFNLIPCGILQPDCVNVVGAGTVVHVPSFLKEIEGLEAKGLPWKNKLFLSDRAHVVFDLHRLVDGYQEQELKNKVGTTGKGIGPAYSAKAARSGIILADIFDSERLENRLRILAEGYRKRYGDLFKYDVDEELNRFKTIYTEKLADLVIDEVPLLASAKQNGWKVVVEGAQATMLCNTFGTYPLVTSSNCSTGGLIGGLSLGWQSIKEVIGVVKAYTTRVGFGPFPTEQINEAGSVLQRIGKEVGVTTGRTRRTGWLDLVQVKYTHDINDYTCINLTKLDILDEFEEIPIAVAYVHAGQELQSFPASTQVLESMEVKYQILPGWKGTKTSGAKTWEELPPNCQAYVEFVEKKLGVKIKYIGTGPGRTDMIVR